VIQKQLQVTNEASTVGDQWSLSLISYIRSKHNLVLEQASNCERCSAGHSGAVWVVAMTMLRPATVLLALQPIFNFCFIRDFALLIIACAMTIGYSILLAQVYIMKS